MCDIENAYLQRIIASGKDKKPLTTNYTNFTKLKNELQAGETRNLITKYSVYRYMTRNIFIVYHFIIKYI